ncbi:MAG: phosphodiester glycosidase family protein [Desulfarculales bacterium]|jgi:hypothetical protein|nr:phosphodiester glycosidase family protein [Desulfarculales bacterium]
MRLRLLIFIFLLSCPLPAGAEEDWRLLSPGLHFRRLEAPTASGSGSPALWVLRIAPQLYRFQILHTPPRRNAAAVWQKESRAIMVCNLGQYDENFNYLGLLVKDGHISSRLSGKQQGLFLAEPSEPGLPQARILDLRYSAFNEDHNPYTQAAQSIMLLDRYGQIRVRQSARAAHRSLLGQDRQGNIIVIVSEGRHTLWELAGFLSTLPWLGEIMCMDGGSEAQLVIATENYNFSWHGVPQSLPDLPWPAARLPVALAVYPR